MPGKEVGFTMYRKDLQMAREIERFSDSGELRDPVLQFELKLRGKSIAKHFGANCRVINGAPRLVRFTLDVMKEVWNTQGSQTVRG